MKTKQKTTVSKEMEMRTGKNVNSQGAFQETQKTLQEGNNWPAQHLANIKLYCVLNIDH